MGSLIYRKPDDPPSHIHDYPQGDTEKTGIKNDDIWECSCGLLAEAWLDPQNPGSVYWRHMWPEEWAEARAKANIK